MLAARGYTCIKSGYFTGADKHFLEASEIVAQDAPASLLEAAALADAHRDSWDAHLLLADVLARSGRCGEAEKAASRAVNLAPATEPIPYLVRGVIHALAGRNDLAGADLDRSIAINERLVVALVARGTLLLRGSGPAAALCDFERALCEAPAYSVPANGRGVALCQKGRHEDAINAFAYALDLDPGYELAARI